MKTDRMLGITVYLLNHGRTSAAALAAEFEVSRRTIQRDMQALCCAGIPVRALYGAGGGYEILHTFRLENLPAYGDDYLHICAALEGLVSAGGDPAARRLLKRLSGPLSPQGRADRQVFLDFGAVLEESGTAEKLRELERAARLRETVRFDYCDAAGNKTRRLAEPLALCYRWYDWYLLAYCRLREDYRLFRLRRIDRLEKNDLPFSRAHACAEQILKQMDAADSRHYLDIRLYCRAKVRLPELLQRGERQEMENGDFILHLRLPQEENLWRGALLSLGGSIKILSPAELREELCEAARTFLSVNGDRQLSPLT